VFTNVFFHILKIFFLQVKPTKSRGAEPAAECWQSCPSWTRIHWEALGSASNSAGTPAPLAEGSTRHVHDLPHPVPFCRHGECIPTPTVQHGYELL